MSKKFDVVTIILMVVLIIALFFVVFNYFTHSNNSAIVNNPHLSMIDPDVNLQNVSGSNTVIKNNVVVFSGDSHEYTSIIEDEPSSGEINKISGDGVIDIVYTENPNSTEMTSTPGQQDNNQGDNTSLIITSNDNISDKEKKEVLKELDQTLMELLDVIDSVQTIDESRLETYESEVQQ